MDDYRKDDVDFIEYLDKDFTNIHYDLHKLIDHVNGIEKMTISMKNYSNMMQKNF